MYEYSSVVLINYMYLHVYCVHVYVFMDINLNILFSLVSSGNHMGSSGIRSLAKLLLSGSILE